MADNFFSKDKIKEYLKSDDKIIRIAKTLERHEDEEKLLGYLQGKISRSLAALYNYWLERDGLPVIHSTAKNFFIFKGGHKFKCMYHRHPETYQFYINYL